jgi:hypothetical protein
MRRATFIGLVAAAGAVGITVGVSGATTGLVDSTGSKQPASFDWFKARAEPTGWRRAPLPGAAVLSYPPQFALASGDRGTVTAEVRDRSGTITGFLNATPRQGSETLANWPGFRIDHQHDEETQIREEARVFGLAFRGGTGSCVIDHYRTPQGRHAYREIACFVVGRRSASVIVAAAPPALWSTVGKELERVISAYQVR